MNEPRQRGDPVFRVEHLKLLKREFANEFLRIDTRRQAGTTTTEIVASVLGFHDMVRRVSAMSDEQAGGIDLVKSAITRIADATRRNAALVEQASAASVPV